MGKILSLRRYLLVLLAVTAAREHATANAADEQEQDNNVPQIPMQVLQDVSTAGNLSQFLQFFEPDSLVNIPVPKDENKEEVLLRSRMNVRSDRLFPTARCEPHLEIVELEKSRDPLTIYWPSCTRIERCSGCCIHELLACTPTKTENVTMKVIKARYADPQAKKFEYTDRKSVTLERHLECECKCRVKESDCKPWQNYRASQCRCVCANEEEEAAKCVGDNRFWDTRKCECVCRNRPQCSTGTFFDETACKCITSADGAAEETFVPANGPPPPPKFRGIYNKAAPAPAADSKQPPSSSPTPYS